MSYKLTFSLTNVTLGDLADFIEAAQELGAPDSAVLQFEGDQVIVEVGESTSSSSARSASDTENAYGTSTSGPRFSANNFGSNVEDTFRRLQSEPAVQDFLSALRELGDNLSSQCCRRGWRRRRWCPAASRAHPAGQRTPPRPPPSPPRGLRFWHM